MANYTIQQLEVFFTIVECGTMSRASETLFLTQPSLSKTLKRLEDGLGFKLFDREVNKLQLTPEGEFFYVRAKPLYQKLNELINTTVNMSKGRTMLRIGYFDSCYTSLVREKIRLFKDMNPDIEVLENCMELAPLRDSLVMGKMDVVFSLSYAVKKMADCRMKNVQQTNLYILMKEDCPMAVNRKLDYEVLNMSTMFFTSTLATQNFEQNDIKRCKEIGFVPKRVIYLENFESCLRAVERGEGFCLSAFNIQREGIYAFELPWMKNRPCIVAAWHVRNRNAALKDFISLFEEVEND